MDEKDKLIEELRVEIAVQQAIITDLEERLDASVREKDRILHVSEGLLIHAYCPGKVREGSSSREASPERAAVGGEDEEMEDVEEIPAAESPVGEEENSQAAVEEDSDEKSAVGKDDDGVEPVDVCYAPEGYSFPIRVYKCLKRPQRLVQDLHMWEKRHEIAVLFSPQDEDCGVHIPDEAIYLIILDNMTWDPMGSVLFFACEMPEATVWATGIPYDLKVGYYYDYRDSLLAWFDDVTSPNAPFPLVEAHQVFRAGIGGDIYKLFHIHCSQVINREYTARLARPALFRDTHALEWDHCRRKEYVNSAKIEAALKKLGVTM